MPDKSQKLRLRRVDRNRFRWPPERSDVAAAGGFVAMVVLFVAQQWVLGLVALVVAVAVMVWPTTAEGELHAGKDGLSARAEAKPEPEVDASYEVEENDGD